MWYKLDVAPPPAGQRFEPLALWVASGNLTSGKEVMRSEVVRVRLQPEEREALAALCGESRTASDVIRLLFCEQGAAAHQPQSDGSGDERRAGWL